jgi:hypothetical protein
MGHGWLKTEHRVPARRENWLFNEPSRCPALRFSPVRQASINTHSRSLTMALPLKYANKCYSFIYVFQRRQKAQ